MLGLTYHASYRTLRGSGYSQGTLASLMLYSSEIQQLSGELATIRYSLVLWLINLTWVWHGMGSHEARAWLAVSCDISCGLFQ